MSQSIDSSPPQIHQILERTWGYETFRPLQQEAIHGILERRDSVVVLPTGGGKSLCFQLPALVEDSGLAVVVSPLISLMKDQVDSLVASGIPAAYFNSSLTPRQQDIVARRLLDGAYRLLYVAPERLVGGGSDRFCQLLAECRPLYVAIDEAHCISQWGHDFRPEYRQLGRLREVFPGISLHGFTATATERVRQDIAAQLGLREPQFLVGSFDRPNLFYRARRRQGFYRQLRAVLDRHVGEAGIVYCQSRKEVDKLSARLRDDGFRAVPYHAGLSDADRHRFQEDFLNERADVVVATVAFGMGIDRSNVRYVVHAAAPRSLEHYQQEAGRAGRDGLEAECALFYSPADFMTWRRMLADSGELDESALQQMREMERYAAQTRCRHRSLVEYFGQELPGESCNACDWCLGELEAAGEPVVLAQKILSCVLRLRQSWGVGQVVDVLRGRATAKVTARGHDRLSTYGLLAEVPIPELRGYVDQLVDGGFLVPSGDRYPVLHVTPLGRRLLKAEVPCELYRQQAPAKSGSGSGRRDEVDWEGVDRQLFESLRQHRRGLAAERQVPPYVIFPDSVLRDLARYRPTSREGLLAIRGVGEKKAEDLGPSFLRLLAEHSAEHGLETDLTPAAGAPAAAAPIPARPRRRRIAGGAFVEASKLFAAGTAIEEVATALDRARSTTVGYLERFLEQTPEADVATWVPAETVERIRAAREDPDLIFERWKDYFDYFEGAISYGQIRLVLAFLKAREEPVPALEP